MKKEDKKMLFEMMEKVNPSFKPKLNEEDIHPYHERLAMNDEYDLIDRAIMSGFITQEEYLAEPEKFVNAAVETEESWKDAEEIGSSDRTYIMKEFLNNAGIRTDFVNNRLTRVQNEQAPAAPQQQQAAQPSDVKALSKAGQTASSVRSASQRINTTTEFPEAFRVWFSGLGYKPDNPAISIAKVKVEVEKVLKQLGYR